MKVNESCGKGCSSAGSRCRSRQRRDGWRQNSGMIPGLSSQIESMAKYRNERSLGSGGFSEVWRVIREEDGEVFAKKVLLDDSPDGVKRFQREVRILARLDHPGIVKIVTTRLDNPPYWYVMPIYEGSLRDEFPEIVGDEELIVKIFCAILDAMQYAHEQGVIHRDLKPENVLLSSDDDLVISDFGLGRAVDAMTTRATFTGQSMGTLGYTAPEQVRDAKNATRLSDIFSLGRILYELYSGCSVTEVQDLRTLPVSIATIVDRCTKTIQAERFQSVDELRSAFRSIAVARGEKTTAERIKALLKNAVADGYLSNDHARELGELLAAAQENADLLHNVCMEIPGAAFRVLWDENQVMAKVLIRVFTDQVSDQGWPFDYTDEIGSACVRLHDATRDRDIRGMLVAAVVEVGVSHNRWKVMDMAVELLSRRKEPEEGLAVAHALAKHRHRVKLLADKVNMEKLDPAVRDLFSEWEE